MKKLLSVMLSVVMVFGVILVISSCNNANTTNVETKETTSQTETTQKEDVTPVEDVTVRVGSLKGPTTIGLVNLMQDSVDGKTSQKYNFTMEAQAATIGALLTQGNLDIALIPANLAANLYNKTSGKVTVIDINTLGVLYCVTSSDISEVKDLDGKTVVTTGQGATPEYALRYLMQKNNVSFELDFKSEATEVASVLSNDPSTIAVIPQPFVTTVLMQNKEVKIAFSLGTEWDKVDETSSLVTGVTVVRTQFLSEHPDLVKQFLSDHKESVEKANSNLDTTASLVVKYGIIPKEQVAKQAIPYCNVSYIDGLEMKEMLSGYLNSLYIFNPASIGGSMPADSFYYTGK